MGVVLALSGRMTGFPVTFSVTWVVVCSSRFAQKQKGPPFLSSVGLDYAPRFHDVLWLLGHLGERPGSVQA